MGNVSGKNKKYEKIKTKKIKEEKVKEENNDDDTFENRLKELESYLKQIELETIKTKYEELKNASENFRCLLQKLDSIDRKLEKYNLKTNDANKIRTINNPGDFENHPFNQTHEDYRSKKKNLINIFDNENIRFQTRKTDQSLNRDCFDEDDFNNPDF